MYKFTNTGGKKIKISVKMGWTVWFMFYCSGVLANTNVILSETDLLTTLFENYKPDVRPHRNLSETIDVRMDIFVMSIDKIDEKRQTFSIRAFLELTWRDDFLSWAPAKYGGVETINVPNTNIWLPDMALLDVYDSLIDLGQKDGRAVIDYNGTVTIWPYKMYTVGCKIKISRFPFDVQTCKMDFLSWTNPVTTLNINTSETMNLGRYSENAEWALEQHETIYYLQPYGNTAWAHVQYIFTLRRKWLFQVLNIIAPIVCISLLNLTCFMLPASCGEKITLSISIFLTLAVFLTIITSSMPESSDEISILGVYVGLQLLGSALTILTTVISLCLYNRDESQRMPLLLRILSKICCQHNKKGRSTKFDQHNGNPLLDDSLRSENNPRATACWSESDVTWATASRAFDRLCLWLAIIWHISLLIGILVGFRE